MALLVTQPLTTVLDTARVAVSLRKSVIPSDYSRERSWKYSLYYGFNFSEVVFQRRIMFRVTISIRSITHLWSFQRESETK